MVRCRSVLLAMSDHWTMICTRPLVKKTLVTLQARIFTAGNLQCANNHIGGLRFSGSREAGARGTLLGEGRDWYKRQILIIVSKQSTRVHLSCLCNGLVTDCQCAWLALLPKTQTASQAGSSRRARSFSAERRTVHSLAAAGCLRFAAEAFDASIC